MSTASVPDPAEPAGPLAPAGPPSPLALAGAAAPSRPATGSTPSRPATGTAPTTPTPPSTRTGATAPTAVAPAAATQSRTRPWPDSWRPRSRRFRSQTSGTLTEALLNRLPALITVVVGAWLLIAYSVGQWRAMAVPSWDLAIFSQLAKDYAHFQAPIVPIKGEGFNLLGDHFHPILVLLGPVWRVFPSPLALLIVQDLLLALSAWPLTRLATRLLSGPAATVLGLVYVLSWGFQGAVGAQFHEIAFAVPLLAWASVAFVEQRWWRCAVWLAPLVLVKEDLGLTILMAGLAIALRGWQAERSGSQDVARSAGARSALTPAPGRAPAWWTSLRARALRLSTVQLGAGLALFGLVSFLVTVLVLLPLLSPSGTWEYGLSSDGATSGAGGLLGSLLSPAVKRTTLMMIVCSAGLIGLGSPWIALVLPTIAWRFLSSKEFYWDWSSWHYNAVLIPIALGALLDVVARLTERDEPARPGSSRSVQPGLASPPSAPVAERAEPEGPEEPRRSSWLDVPLWARWTVVIGVVLPVLAAVSTATQLPLWSMTDKGYGSTSSRAQAADEVLALIPDGATVETDLGLLAYLVPTTTVSWVGTSTVPAEYVVIDSQSTAWGGNPPLDAAQWATEQSNGAASYSLVLDTGGYQVAQRDR